MGWIKNRILAEKRKHGVYGADWARIAEAKIRGTLREEIKEIAESYAHLDNNWTADMAKEILDNLKLNSPVVQNASLEDKNG